MKCDALLPFIEQINNDKIKLFVIAVLNSLDDSFYKMPASTSGKYHHQDSLGEGGLIRHIQRAAYFGKLLIDSERWDADNIKGDILLAAILLHDIGKKEKYAEYKEYYDHPIVAAKMLDSFKGMVPEKVFLLIRNCVLRHMGPFGPKSVSIENCNILEKYTYIADFYSSRKEVDITQK